MCNGKCAYPTMYPSMRNTNVRKGPDPNMMSWVGLRISQWDILCLVHTMRLCARVNVEAKQESIPVGCVPTARKKAEQ